MRLTIIQCRDTPNTCIDPRNRDTTSSGHNTTPQRGPLYSEERAQRRAQGYKGNEAFTSLLRWRTAAPRQDQVRHK